MSYRWVVKWSLLVIALLGPSGARAEDEMPAGTRTEDVIYARKYGTALTMDVFTPKHGANGLGVIFVVSGGWVSSHEGINPAWHAELLKRGYTVFCVVHGSQPLYTVPEILEDMYRSARFIRFHAARYGIDPDRIGVFGCSAGGHLSLMMGVAGQAGDPAAKDPVDRLSSRVQAVAAFCPPTDLLNYGQPGRDFLQALHEELAPFHTPLDFREFDPKAKRFRLIQEKDRRREIARQISPITHVTRDDPPTLIIHGDADKLVWFQQAEVMIARLTEAGVVNKLVVKPGAGHGWPDLLKDVVLVADWFDRHLGRLPASQPS